MIKNYLKHQIPSLGNSYGRFCASSLVHVLLYINEGEEFVFMLLIADCKLTIPFQNMTSSSSVIDYEQRYFTVNSPFQSKLFLTYSFRPYRGSVLTWSSISYSVSGRALLEYAYEWQANHQISRRGRGGRTKGEKMKTFFRFFSMWESRKKRL